MSAGAGGPGTSTGRPHVHRDRSPPVDDSLGRQDRRHARWRDRRGRNPRRADDPGIVLPPARTEASWRASLKQLDSSLGRVKVREGVIEGGRKGGLKAGKERVRQGGREGGGWEKGSKEQERRNAPGRRWC